MEDGSSIGLLLAAVAQPLSSSAPANTSLILDLMILFLLILVNAFFSATEIAVITLNDNKVRRKAEEGDPIARKLVKLMFFHP